MSLRHSALVVHDWPGLSREVQVPDEHQSPLAHPMVVLLVQVVPQLVAVPHDSPFGHAADELPAEHTPDPLHAVNVVRVEPAHDVAEQPLVPLGQSSQTPPAAQLPSVLHVDLAEVAHTLFGSGVPGVTLPQVPLAPPVCAVVQPWHLAVHAELQQTPSAQKPLVHWLVPPHVVPFASLAVHTPPVPQKLPLAQSASFAHVVVQAPAVQR